MVNRVKGENKFAKGRRGLADLVRLDAGRVRIDFEKLENEEKAPSFPINVTYGEDGTIPEYVPVKRMKDGAKIRASVTMNEDGSAILFATPANGEFDAKLDKFVAKEGEQPVPESRPGKKGKPYKVFAVLLQITSGPWAGCNCWYQMYPNFGKDEAGMLAVSGEGTGSDALYDFMEATGVTDHEIPFSENPLPEIQRLALAENRNFRIIIVKGWVDRIIAPLGDEDAFVDENGNTESPKVDAPEPVVTHPALDE